MTIQGYPGLKFKFPLGTAGLHTDDAADSIPVTDLTYTVNVVANQGVVEGTPGAIQYNATQQLPGAVVACWDYWPDAQTQRMIAVCLVPVTTNGQTLYYGRIYRSVGGYVGWTEVTPEGGTPGSTVQVANGYCPNYLTITNDKQVHIVEGGHELANNLKKLFIFTGNDPVQVIYGDGTTRANLAYPNSDWDPTPAGVYNATTGTAYAFQQTATFSSYPVFGIIYRTRLFLFCSGALGHRIYASLQNNQEDFQSYFGYGPSPGGGDQFTLFVVYPGEQDGFNAMGVYQSRLFAFKSPRGIYFLNDNGGLPSGPYSVAGVYSASLAQTEPWYFTQLNMTFGIASPHSFVPVLSDALIANSSGSITSMSAVFQLGDVKNADLMMQLRAEQYLKDYINPIGNTHRWGIYYENGRKAFFAYQGAGSVTNDKVLEIDLSRDGKPKVFWHECFQANCFATRRDVYGLLRPIYGSNDGYIYIMDRPDRTVAGTGYVSTFQTSQSNFEIEQHKIYEHLEVVFESTGNWNFMVDVFVDDKYTQTVYFPVYYRYTLDAIKCDSDPLLGRAARSFIKPIKGTGERISFKCYNSGIGDNFKILGLIVYYRMGGDAQKAPASA